MMKYASVRLLYLRGAPVGKAMPEMVHIVLYIVCVKFNPSTT